MWMMEGTASPSVMPVQKVYWTHPTQACEFASKGHLEQKKKKREKMPTKSELTDASAMTAILALQLTTPL